jgi:hypothetical protein
MTDHTIQTRNAPRQTIIRSKDPDDQKAYWVRAYRQSPEDVYLQLRWKGRYVGVSLTFDEARALGAHLIGEAGGR